MEQRKRPPSKRLPEDQRVHLLVCVIPTKDDYLYAIIKDQLDHLTSEMDDPIILHRNEDKLVGKWAQWNWYLEKVFYLDTEKTTKQNARFVRNSEMLKIADYVVLFWDGKDTALSDILTEARSLDKETIVIEVTDE